VRLEIASRALSGDLMSDTSIIVPSSSEQTEKPGTPKPVAPSPAPAKDAAPAAPATPGTVSSLAGAAELTDQQLMERSKGGDMTPYALLFKRHADRIWRMAYMILHSSAAAEDVTQETFTRGLTHISSYRGEAEPRAWFSSIALNLCRHYLRDKNKEAELADSAKLERGGRVGRPRTRGALSSAVRRETNRLLAVALGYLTQAQREVFVLHYVDDLPYEEVSQILEIRPGAARALAHRAKAVLQKQLGPALDALAKS
jgi:RNA polymerase sigma-70 factor, ECF subfamily